MILISHVQQGIFQSFLTRVPVQTGRDSGEAWVKTWNRRLWSLARIFTVQTANTVGHTENTFWNFKPFINCFSLTLYDRQTDRLTD